MINNQPPITVSSLDLVRLTKLIESLPPKYLPGIDALQCELDRATIVEPGEVPSGVITMNSKARFVDELTKKTFELTLVYPEDGGNADRVSILAPVGGALLGLSVGQSIFWQVPGGQKLQLTILEVIFQPEAAGELLR